MIIKAKTTEFKSVFSTISSILSKCAPVAKTEGYDCIIEAPKEGEEQEVTLRSITTDVFLSYKFLAKVDEVGKILVNASYLAGLKLPGPETELSCDGTAVKYKSGRLSGNFPAGQNLDEVYENAKQLEKLSKKDSSIKLKTSELATAVKSIFFQAKIGQVDMLVSAKENVLELILDESFRAAFYKMELKEKTKFHALVPSHLFSFLLPKIKEDYLEIAIDDRLIQFSTERMKFIHPLRQSDDTKKIKGWLESQMSNVDKATKYLVSAEEVKEAVESTGSIYGPLTHSAEMLVTLCVDKERSKVICKAESPVAKAKMSFNVNDLVEGQEGMLVVLNKNSFTEFLSMFGKGELTMHVWEKVLIMVGDNATYILGTASR